MTQMPAPKTRKAAAASTPKPAVPAKLDFDLLPGLIGYQLRLTQLAIFGDFGHSLLDQAISPGRFGVLVLIGANPGMTQSRLALATQLDRSTMVAVIDQLEARHLVERRSAPNDRRSNALWLTEDGKKLLRAMKRRVRAHETHIAAALGDDDTARLIDMLARIRKHLQPKQAGQD
ncbi:transcriptional regulator SlyA [mine drainage metagenome]|uniref:Transcriptional regulator SlyA n=1 Tax=mine drainage metagenome TaxID=410659 RepID=A0A1J5SJ27_9ZZZZ